jgi:glycosyltransferase involved in cell wall biosynthesis
VRIGDKRRVVVALVGVDTNGDAPGGIATISRSIINGFIDDPVIDIVPITNFDEGSILRRLAMGVGAAYKVFARRDEFDLVHLQVATGWSIQRDLCVVIASRLGHIPVVAQYHGPGQIEDFTRGSAAHRLCYRLLIKSCDNVALGTSVFEWLESVNSDASRAIISNGVIIPELPPTFSEDHPNIIFVGRLGTRKGIFDLLTAVDILYKRGYQFGLSLLGDGDLAAVRRRIDASEHLQQFVTVFGWQDATRVNEALRKSWGLVLPSFEEGLPMAILEAMASGRAVVATRVGDVEDAVIDGENGFLVEPGDVEALAGALHRIVSERALAEALGERGYEICREKFSHIKVIGHLHDLYLKIVEREQFQRERRVSNTSEK